VLDFYAAADLYVSPSLEDSFGLPVAEAMACGLPAISSLFAGVSELIESGVDGFLLRDPRDPKELASLLEELFHHQEQRERIGQAAAQKALSWTWDRNASETWKFLRQALARKSRQTRFY
jgi:glycosyltransferase involved in cell wall biosynthesis